jgi:putative ABC transport system permease protein
MIRNYLKIALRVINRQKLFAAINIFGLSIGLASAMLLFFYVNHELSYERSFSKSDRIYRIDMIVNVDNNLKELAVTPNILAPTLSQEIPEVENYTRIFGASMFDKAIILKGEDYFIEDKLFYADSTVFDLFDVPIIAGNKNELLNSPDKVVLSKNTAKKYFGNQSAIGETLVFEDKVLEVTGIYENFSSNSHIHPELIISWSTAKSIVSLRWGSSNYYSYILVNNTSAMMAVEEKMKGIIDENLPEELKAIGMDFQLQPISDIHLLSKADFNPEAGGDIRYVYAFIAVAVFILLIAAFNYMNLSTAKSAERAREVGMRKVMGAYRGQLIVQFIGESFVITCISILLAIGIVELVKPYFFNLIEQEIDISLLKNIKFWGLLLSGSLLVSVFSAFYPALALSSYRPSSILVGRGNSSGSGSTMRKGLVILQFAISTALILGTFVVFQQLNFMQRKKLGFNKEQVLIIQTSNNELHDNADALRSAMISHSNIINVASTSAYPGRNSGGMIFNAEGMDESEKVTVWEWRVDEHLVNTLGLELLQGRDFQPTDIESKELEFIINQTAVSIFGWDENDCIGKSITMGAGSGKCIGVIKDFHFSSMKQEVEPMALCMRKGFHKYFVIRMGNGDIKNTVDFVGSKWKVAAPNEPFNYYFLDRDFERLFKNEKKVSQVFLIFAVLTITIACLGLFGLSSYSAVQRTKEIGIRKAMGSTISEILYLFIKDNMKFILISLLFALPFGLVMMNKWLEGFAYRISIGWEVILLVILVVILVAVSTVIFHALKAANTNPVESLRHE